MKISRDMLRHHLAPITVYYFADHDLHPSDPREYIPSIEIMRERARREGDLPALKLALGHILSHPEEEILDLNAGTYAFSNERLIDVIDMVYFTLWPGEQPPAAETAAKVELVEMPEAEWAQARAKLPA